MDAAILHWCLLLGKESFSKSPTALTSCGTPDRPLALTAHSIIPKHVALLEECVQHLDYSNRYTMANQSTNTSFDMGSLDDHPESTNRRDSVHT
jgi:hypothetical protein